MRLGKTRVDPEGPLQCSGSLPTTATHCRSCAPLLSLVHYDGAEGAVNTAGEVRGSALCFVLVPLLAHLCTRVHRGPNPVPRIYGRCWHRCGPQPFR